MNKDIILLESKYVYQDGTIFDYKYIEPQITNGREEFSNVISKNLCHAIMKVVWAKLIRREAIGNLRFNIQQTIGEDTLFMYDLLKRCSSIGIFTGYTYYWLYNGGDGKKYKQHPEVAAVYASNIYRSYMHLWGTGSVEVELFIINYFFMLCDSHNCFYLRPWFKNEDVRKMNTYLLNTCPDRLDEGYKLHLKPVYVQLFLRLKRRGEFFLRKMVIMSVLK